MARTRSPEVSVADVARLADVSIGTASKALNGRGQLRAETREKVIVAATELGYHYNPLVGAKFSQRTYTVGVLTSDSIGRFTIPLLTGAEDVLGAGQMAMLLCESRADPIREQHYIRNLLARRVDGIIVTGRSSDVRRTLGRDFPVPVVYALTQSDDPDDLSITADDAGGTLIAINHLLETGRRQVAHVTGPERHLATQRRLSATVSALEAAGEKLVGEPLFGEWSEQWGRSAARRLVAGGEPFTGVFCGSDQIAKGMLDGLRESGIDVPTAVGVVGVDNWDVMALAARPQLTTVDLNLAAIGNTAATRLLAAIDGNPSPGGVETVPSFLVQRASTEFS